MINYLYYYNQSGNREQFVNLVKQSYPKTKENTIKRRYYDCKNTLDYNKINLMLRVKLKDIIRMKIKITPQFLRNEGYSYEEIKYIMEKTK